MPVLQWGMLCVLSLLLSIGFLALHLPAALLLGPMIAGIIFSMRGATLQLPRSAFLAAQAILGCMIAQNLTGSILTTLAVNWPIVLAILLVTLLSSAIVGWLLVRYSSLPGNTGAWGSSPGGAALLPAEHHPAVLHLAEPHHQLCGCKLLPDTAALLRSGYGVPAGTFCH